LPSITCRGQLADAAGVAEAPAQVEVAQIVGGLVLAGLQGQAQFGELLLPVC